MQIKDFKNGEKVQFDAFIASLNERDTKKGDKFITVVFKDGTGEISGNIWKTSLETFAHKVNHVVTVFGSIGEYEGKIQLNVSTIDKCNRPIGDFGRKSSKDPVAMFKIIKDTVDGMKNPLIKYLIEELIVSNEVLMNLYMNAPAAKGVHHPWTYGLVEHVSGMIGMAKLLIPHYQYYYPVDEEKVFFGLIMHDAGKILEYDFSGPNITYTRAGVLLHHIGIVTDMVSRTYSKYLAANKLTEDVKNTYQELQHIIYSHHGQIEWNALVKPASVEAMLVHQLDYMDAKMMHIYEMIQQGEGDIKGMSKKSFIEQQSYILPKKEV